MSTSSTTREGTRFSGLDTLRGLAVLRVVFYHFTTRYHELFGGQGDPTLGLRRSDFSVPMFFVISGFVIPLTLQKSASVRDFAFLRLTRLYPTYLVCIVTSFAVVTIAGLPGWNVSTGDALLNLTMIPHALGAEYVDRACWTLQVELAFYAIMAVLMAASWLRLAPLVLLALAGVHAASVRYGWDVVRDANFFRYVHLFAIGSLLHEMRYSRRTWHTFAFVAVWVLSYLSRGGEYLAWIAVFFALTAASVFWDPQAFRIRVLVWFGALSYPFYLLHQNIGYVVLRAADRAQLGPYAGIALAFVVTLGLAYVAHRSIELPAMNWVRERRRARRAAEAGAPGHVASGAN